MGQIPWYQKFLSILMSWINYYSVKTPCLRCSSLLPFFSPSLLLPQLYWAWPVYVFWRTECEYKWSACSKLRLYELWSVFHLPLWELPTMPRQEQALGKHWSKKKEKHEEQTWKQTAAWSRAIPASQQTYEQLTNTYCYTLQIFCGWFLCSITLSIAN